MAQVRHELAEVHAQVEQHEEHWWKAEVSRLRDILLLRQTEHRSRKSLGFTPARKTR